MNEAKTLEALRRAVAMGMRTLATLQETCAECGSRLKATGPNAADHNGVLFCREACAVKHTRREGY